MVFYADVRDSDSEPFIDGRCGINLGAATHNGGFLLLRTVVTISSATRVTHGASVVRHNYFI